MNFQFGAVWGSQGCREKNPNCHKYATFDGSLSMFSWKKIGLESAYNFRIKHCVRFSNRLVLMPDCDRFWQDPTLTHAMLFILF
jgi:hypothetical protein